MSYKNERWFKVLLDSVATYGSKKAVSERLGISRSQVSSVINGPYKADTKHIAAKVMAILDRWHCPYLGADITAEECFSIHSGPTPSHDPARLAHRRMCRTCQHNQSNQLRNPS